MDLSLRQPILAGTAAVLLATCAFPLHADSYEVVDGHVLRNGEPIELVGVNWFGAETSNHVPHGLWARGYQDMIQQIRELGFNAVRLPFCPATLNNAPVTSIDYAKNPDLRGLGSLEVLDRMIAELDRNGIYVLLDHHSPDCNAISELWYSGEYSEQDWIDDLTFLARRYADIPSFIGIDPKNEPHGAATWGTGNSGTDWDQAAARAAKAVLQADSDILVFVEGIQENPVCSFGPNHWWGGNLELQNCVPLDIPDNKLVFSPHVYGPDVHAQPFFDDPSFPANMPPIWDQHFGFLANEGRVVAPGEFGGKYGHGGNPDDVLWQDALIDYLADRGVCNFFYWSWNPNSGDTGGILQDDWSSVWRDKVDNLHRLVSACGGETVTACSDGIDNDGDGLMDLDDPGCASVWDTDETDPLQPPLAQCADGIDNDGDGRIDLVDTGCADAGDDDESDPLPPPPPQCADGIDNDSDGHIDLSDDGCTSTEDDDEADPSGGTGIEVTLSTQSEWSTGYCADGLVTNHSTNKVVWAVDIRVDGPFTKFWNGLYQRDQDNVKVRGVAWNAELAPGGTTSFGFCAKRGQTPPAAACSDGRDNDGDGLIDSADPGCTDATADDETDPVAPSHQCSDGLDNDGDGLVDLADPECTASDDDSEQDLSDPSSIRVELLTQSDWGTGYCTTVVIHNTSATAVDWTATVPIEGHTTSTWNAIVDEHAGMLDLAGLSWNNLVPAESSIASVGFCAER